MKQSRIMIAASGSGSGKTMVVLGLLQALKERGLTMSSCKCGPDYIDPMFHRTLTGDGSINLDSFFCGEHTLRYLLQNVSKDSDMCVIEGVMGYYDGLGGISDRASSYDVARITDTPVILVLDAKGMSQTLVPVLKGLKEYREDSRIRGVILNHISGSYYPVLKKMIEERMNKSAGEGRPLEGKSGDRKADFRVYGYLPELESIGIDSRYLGLVMPDEVPGLKAKLKVLAGKMEETVDIDGMIRLAGQAGELPPERDPAAVLRPAEPPRKDSAAVRLGLAYDEAFCFQYRENLKLLEKLGAGLVPFSPLRDGHLPDDLDGLLLYGGYPELHLRQLSENRSMLADVKNAIEGGLPTMAECGGFMYLFGQMEDMEGKAYPVAGVIPGKAYYTGKLTRFGYVSLTERTGTLSGAAQRNMSMSGTVRAHEFHYYDTTDNGDAFLAEKPMSSRSWNCMHLRGNLMAGFPHLYYYSNPEIAENFLDLCRDHREKRTGKA